MNYQKSENLIKLQLPQIIKDPPGFNLKLIHCDQQVVIVAYLARQVLAKKHQCKLFQYEIFKQQLKNIKLKKKKKQRLISDLLVLKEQKLMIKRQLEILQSRAKENQLSTEKNRYFAYYKI